MRVIIAGGGISGLALAGSLEKAGIDYVLLEARDCVDPQVGASIAINAGSMRVLDQLGAADEIIDQTTPITTVNHHNPDGTFISPSGNDWVLLGARFFYETAFMDRQLALRAMANSIHQKEKILLKQRVKSVDHTDTGVTVHCEDGSSFSGDVLIGCDGVNSKTRSEMWRIANKAEPGYFDAAEKTKMTAEYSCLVGISTGMDKMGMTVGDVDYVYDKGKSFLVFCGKNGRSFWFFFQKMNKIYNRNDPDFPRFTKEDAEQIAVENGWRPCHSKLKFRDLWNNRFSYALVPMEECLYEKWSWGRMAVVGDGSHKMTANHGAAGNNAIESAIAMANSLQRIHDRGDLSTSTIRKTFIEWQQKRQARIDDTVKAAAMICRMHGQATWKDRLMVYWVMPNANSLLSNIYRDQIIGAEILEYLPVPERSFLGNTPFNPVRGIGFEVDVMKRALFALPLLAIWFCMYRFSAGPALTSFVEASRDTDTAQWMRVLLYPADVGLIYAIWLIEGARLGNELSLMQVPLVFGLLSTKFGPGTVAPWYFYLHYIGADVSKFASADNRLTAVGYTRTILPVLLITTYLPLFLTIPTEYASWFWTLSPLLIGLAQYALVKTGLSPNTVGEDRLDKNKLNIDMKYIRITVSFLSAVSSAVWILFLRSSMSSPQSLSSGSSVLSCSWLALTLSSLVWITLLIGDLKKVGMLDDQPWIKLLASGLAITVLGGPMTAAALSWLMREEILLSRRENTAMVREKFSGKTVIEVQRTLAGVADGKGSGHVVNRNSVNHWFL